MKNSEFKNGHTEESALSSVNKIESKIILSVVAKFIFVCVVLIMSDILFDVLDSITEFVMELISTLILIVESVVGENLEERLFLDKYQSDLIILNTAVVVVGIILFYFIKALPGLIMAAKKQLLKKIRAYYERSVLRWNSYSTSLKLKLFLIYILGCLGLSLLAG
jgi:hypothetical protein